MTSKNMKAIKFLKYILVALLPLMAASCEEEFTPGEQDRWDCHKLFFPQSQKTDYVISPSESHVLTFTVEREEIDDEAEVPYILTPSEDGIFTIEDEYLYFKEDQAKTTFNVVVSDKCELGKTYTCSIKVTEPLYVSNYSLASNELTFSVVVVDWQRMTNNGSDTGLWRDDFYTSFCKDVLGIDIEMPYYEKEVEIYQRADLPGYYRVDNVYTADYVSYLTDGSDRYAEDYAELCPGGSIYINATDPAKVYVDLSFAFNHGAYGPIYMASYVPEVFLDGINLYGTLKDGSITFPKSGLVAYVPTQGGFAYVNTAGKQRLVLPGYRGYDYTLSVETAPSVKGVMPITFTLGDDVAKVEYQVFDGHLTDVDLVTKLDEVKKHKDVKTVTESGTYDFKTEKTGFYTIIACSYDAAGNFKEYTCVKFGYDTATDPRDVDVHMGLIVSDKYAGGGLTTENSMEFYVYGTDLVEVKVTVVKKAHYDDFREVIDQEVDTYLEPIGYEELALVNGIGYSGVLGGMEAGTEYVLIVYADNGYHSGTYTVTASTEGVFDPLQADYTFYDMPSRLQSDKTAYFKDWDVWSVNIGNGDDENIVWERTKRCTATILEDEKDLMYDEDGKLTLDPEEAEDIMDMVTLKGMYPNASAKYGFKDEVQLNYYEGFVYTMRSGFDPCKYEGSTIYPTTANLYVADNSLYVYWEDGAMIGGFVDESQKVIAFVGNPRTTIGTYGFSYVAMCIGYYTSENYGIVDGELTELPKPLPEDCHVYPMLISPDVEFGKNEAASMKTPKACRLVSDELSKVRANYVETEDGYMKSTIDRIKARPYDYMRNIVEEAATYAQSASVDFTMTKSDRSVNLLKKADFHEAVLR